MPISRKLTLLGIIGLSALAATTAQAQSWRVGVGMSDVTGEAAEVGMMGYAELSQKTLSRTESLYKEGLANAQELERALRLTTPLLRVGPRGSGDFKEISWEEALTLATQWMGEVRAKDPKRLAMFTGRDQSQSLTGWWAQQYGTINYAAHGGFCSVNMAAGGLYTLGGSFWEFGEPDWEHARYLMMWGVAEDHDSNPIKLGLGKLKGRGAKIVAVNPIRSSALVDVSYSSASPSLSAQISPPWA